MFEFCFLLDGRVEIFECVKFFVIYTFFVVIVGNVR